VPAHRARRRSGVATLLRAGAIALGALCFTAWSSAPANAAAPSTSEASGTDSPALPPARIPLDRPVQHTADPTEVQVPDTVTAQEVKSEYGLGIVLLVLVLRSAQPWSSASSSS